MEPIWSPSPERIARAKLTHFMRGVRERQHAPVPESAALHRWATAVPETCWRALGRRRAPELRGKPSTQRRRPAGDHLS
jgi:hypothetical protein